MRVCSQCYNHIDNLKYSCCFICRKMFCTQCFDSPGMLKTFACTKLNLKCCKKCVKESKDEYFYCTEEYCNCNNTFSLSSSNDKRLQKLKRLMTINKL
jgi:hypothetical protein